MPHYCTILITALSLSIESTAVPAQSVARSLTTPAPAQTIQTPTTTGLEAKISIDLDGVPLSRALEAIGRQASLAIAQTDPVLRVKKRITLQTTSIRAADAFRTVLRGTNVTMTISPTGRVLFDVPEQSIPRVQGTLSGKVLDGSTKQPIAGATVQIEGVNRSAQTAEDGSFRLVDVPVGVHHLVVRRIGYGKASQAVAIGEGATVSVEVRLEVSASVLDQLVVTGTIIQTELKAVPSAITVVTGKQLEERGITKIDQLFRGDVPGLFAQNQGSLPNALLDEVTMFSRGATALASSSAGVSVTTGSTNPIKTYLDGVELADPKYLSQIDPKSIDRIEILTGPQASTIYGSNAINGVMQIFTKRGTTSHPQLTLNLLSGWVENDFRSTRTPQHDYSAQLNGLEGRLAYNAGATWNYIGPWTPAKQTDRTSAFGGARLESSSPVGRLSADVTLRRSITRNRQRGSTEQGVTAYQETGWYRTAANAGLNAPTTGTLTGQTLGMTLGYTPTSWWSHTLTFGQDQSTVDNLTTDRGYSAPFDTTLALSQNQSSRRSLQYATTVHVPIASIAHATATVGADAWESLTSVQTVAPQTLTGSLTGATFVSRRPSHNAGGFLQAQVAAAERLFLTYGLRAEWNPNFGDVAQPNYAPRYGVAYVQEVGAVTAKLRASYGKATRPPAPTLKASQTAFQRNLGTTVISDYGNFDVYLANADLTPEHQQGGEGGVELYFGTRGSLIVTQYNQVVDGLIAGPMVDSVRSFGLNPAIADKRDPAGYGYEYQYQYVNLGSIRNQGWELQGSVVEGPFTVRGTYSWMKSRTIGVNPKYRNSFQPNLYPQYQPGATFAYVPERTWAGGVSYARARTVLSINVTGTGRAKNNRDVVYYESFNSIIRLPQNRLNMGSGNGYLSFTESYAMADLNASHRFAPRVEGLFQVQNLTNKYVNDYQANYAAIGRQTKMGLRLRLD